MQNKKIDIISYILTMPLFLLFWELISRSGIYNINLFPPPSIVFQALTSMLVSGELFLDTTSSLIRVFIGFFSGSILGIVIGLFTGRIKLLQNTIGQLIHFVRPIPVIAVVPLAIVWFGIGEISKYLLIAYGVFIIVWINTHIGVSNIKRVYIWSAKSLGANNKSLSKDIILPAAFPNIIAGLRTGIAVAFIVLVAAEIAGAYAGLGFRISTSYLVFRVDKMMVGLIILGILGALSDRILVFLVNQLLPWYKLAKEEK